MNGSGRNVSTRALTNNNGNKRAVAIVHLGGDEEGTAGGTFTGPETGYCPIAHRMVEAEEKHLSYGAVELRPSELNRGNTAERQRRLQQRRRQVQYGKETVGYTKYISVVPNRWEREFQNPMHPITPRPEFDCSKRTFDRYLNVWRRQLHLWDEYDPHNVAPQYTKIGIPTLGRLGLERVQNVPDEQQCGLLSFTPTTAQGITGGTACTPVVPRHVRREMSLSMPSALHQRSVPYPMSGFSTLSGPHSSSAGAPNVRSSSVCGGGSCSITNTPHTPYYGSTRSNSSYPLPFLSVLAQPTIYSPHWPDSSRQSSPNPHGTQRSYGYSYNSGGACSSVPAGCGMYMEGGNHYPNSSYSCRNHNSPYGGYRGTPHSSPNVYHYPYYNNGGSMNMAPPSPMCVGHEAWSNSQRQ
ncbi:unnamed protein product [Trypanosoma congolense IL3000]|nr:unnamed protein product [Trypanosoma congolense IL3000]